MPMVAPLRQRLNSTPLCQDPGMVRYLIAGRCISTTFIPLVPLGGRSYSDAYSEAYG